MRQVIRVDLGVHFDQQSAHATPIASSRVHGSFREAGFRFGRFWWRVAGTPGADRQRALANFLISRAVPLHNFFTPCPRTISPTIREQGPRADQRLEDRREDQKIGASPAGAACADALCAFVFKISSMLR